MTTFLDLTDTPVNYTDAAGKIPVVNEEESGLEFKATSELAAALDSITRPDCTDLADDDVRAIKDDELREKIYRFSEAIKRCLIAFDSLLFGADGLGGVRGPPGTEGTPGSPGATGPAGEDGATIINQNGASPAYSFTRSGLVETGTYLYQGENPSNITGKRQNLYNASVTGVHIACGTADTFSVGVYYHDGSLTNLVFLASFAVAADTGADYINLAHAVPRGKQMAMKVETGTVTNGVDAGIVMAGTLTP
jgi:hypothetical protein